MTTILQTRLAMAPSSQLVYFVPSGSPALWPTPRPSWYFPLLHVCMHTSDRTFTNASWSGLPRRRPGDAEDEVVIPKAIQLVDGPYGIVPQHKVDECKASRLACRCGRGRRVGRRSDNHQAPAGWDHWCDVGRHINTVPPASCQASLPLCRPAVPWCLLQITTSILPFSCRPRTHPSLGPWQ